MTWQWAVASGAVLGLAYTLSPLAVLCVAGMIAITRWAGRDLTGRERDWFFILFTTAIVLRLAVIGALVLSADGSKPYTVFFGDEWIYKSRPIWMRNIGLGIPISAADFIYAFDPTGMSGHLYVLAVLQALVGDAPYGIHLLNVMLYVGAIAILHRLVRRAFGAFVAFGGSAVLLFLPSLFAWSVSVLKEPMYIAAAVIELLLVLAVIRARGVARRIAAAVALVVVTYALDALRTGTLAMVAVGAVGGWATPWITRTPRRMVLAAAAVPVALVIALAQAPVQARVMTVARELMRYHAGHVMTPGVSYKIVDPRYYGTKWIDVWQASPREVLQYMVRAPIAYVIEPSPSNVQSRLLSAYLPEHFAWLVLVGLVPFGVRPAFRRDGLLAGVLLAHGAAISVMVALTSGNIGTLVRHRGLSLPYLVWFSMLGAAAIITWAARPARTEEQVADDVG